MQGLAPKLEVMAIPSPSSTMLRVLESSAVHCACAQYLDSSCAAIFFSFTIRDLKAVTTASQEGRGFTAVLSQYFNTSRSRSTWSEYFCSKQSSSVCGMSNSSPILYQLARTGWSSLSSAFRFGSVYMQGEHTLHIPLIHTLLPTSLVPGSPQKWQGGGGGEEGDVQE